METHQHILVLFALLGPLASFTTAGLLPRAKTKPIAAVCLLWMTIAFLSAALLLAARWNEPVLNLPESREFYWSKIERSIASAERIAPPAASRPWWMRLVAPLAGAVALFAVLMTMVDRNASNPIAISQSLGSAVAPMHEVEQQSTDVSTITFRSEAEGVTVVWVSNTK